MNYSAYFSACEHRGRLGEDFLQSELERQLSGTGLTVRLTRNDDANAPFDLEVLDGSRLVAVIENKDLRPTTQGTWIKKSRKLRKLEYAKDHDAALVLTTVTLRASQMIGFREGIVNGSPTVFDYDFSHLVTRILAARGT